MNIPQITDIETALRIFYQYPEIGTREMLLLFTQRSKSTINRLKRLAQKQMLDDKVHTRGMYKVNTKSAYKAWGIDIEDLENRRNKLLELGL